jgi:hypothetical protein
MTLNNASASYRGMSTNSADFKTRSKSLIDTPPEDQKDLTGTITTNGTTISTTNGKTDTILADTKDLK